MKNDLLFIKKNQQDLRPRDRHTFCETARKSICIRLAETQHNSHRLETIMCIRGSLDLLRQSDAAGIA